MSESRQGGVRQIMRDLHKWQRKWVDSLVAVGVLAVLGGAFALSLPNADTMAHAVGVAAISAGFSVLIGAFTGKRAAYEQYAKEANLRRRDKVYNPLYSELRYVQETLEQAASHILPYPLFITSGQEQGDQIEDLFGFERIHLAKWPTFKTDARKYDLKPSTQRLLDDLLSLAEAYTEAVQATQAPTETILGNSFDEAAEEVKRRPAFAAWQKEFNDPEHHKLPHGIAPRLEYDWCELLIQPLSQGETIGSHMAPQWVRQLQLQGWVIGGDQQAVAKRFRAWFGGNYAYAPPPESWTADIIAAAWPELNSHPTYHRARDVEKKLYRLTSELERQVATALQDIQDRYEGGKPLV